MLKPSTIVAQATGPAKGGVGIIRLSGPQALHITQKLFSSLDKSNAWQAGRMYYGQVLEPSASSQNIIDDGYAVYFQTPKSFTGEDCVELHLHGNPIVLQHVVQMCLDQGADMAGPGEFTQRAFLNGKMDLSRAEAVAELIAADSLQAAAFAQKRMQGQLSKRIVALYEQSLDVLAECEADIDFPDENLDIQDKQHILAALQDVCQKLLSLEQSYRQQNTLDKGFKIVLLGQPNVGKSSLFNAMLEQDRAIVSVHAGTTRDAIKESLNINGVLVQMVDTAGLRQGSSDKIENLGMNITRQESESADMLCLMHDLQINKDTKDNHCAKESMANIEQFLQDFLSEHYFIQNAQRPLCLLINKTDLVAESDLNALKMHLAKLQQNVPVNIDQVFLLSAQQGQGLNDLRQFIADHLQNQLNSDNVLIGNLRQKNLLEKSRICFEKAQHAWQSGQAEEFVALDLREGQQYLMQLLGKEDISEEILDTVFAKFCVGK